jgi:SAM-dependent methyltransferase
MADVWDDLSGWWVDAVRDDPTQSDELLAVLADLVPGTGGSTIDLGCGEGQAMRMLGAPIVGTDLAEALLHRAAHAGPVVRARLPDLSWVRPNSFDRAICIGVLDLIEDERVLFTSAASIVRPGGHLLVVMNHPAATAPGSEPLVDAEGTILWKWGSYLEPGDFDERVEGHHVRLRHRPLGQVLTSAAASGWDLASMTERGLSAATVDRHPEFRGQEQIPTILGVRWTRRPGAVSSRPPAPGYGP